MDLAATLIIMLVFAGAMVFFFVKLRIWVVILMIYLFSLIFGGLALQQGDIPFTPYLQFFFLLFQSVFFILTSQEYYKRRRS